MDKEQRLAERAQNWSREAITVAKLADKTRLNMEEDLDGRDEGSKTL